MSAWSKAIAATLGLGVPLAVIGVDVAWFSSNPLVVIFAVTVLVGGAMYLLTYREHE